MTARRWCEIEWDTCPARSTITSPACRALVSVYTRTSEGWGAEGEHWRCARGHHGRVDVIDDVYFEGEEMVYLAGPVQDKHRLPELATLVEVVVVAQIEDGRP